MSYVILITFNDIYFIVNYATMPVNVDIQCVSCRTFNSIVVHSMMNVRQSIHFGLSIRHIHRTCSVLYIHPYNEFKAHTRTSDYQL